LFPGQERTSLFQANMSAHDPIAVVLEAEESTQEAAQPWQDSSLQSGPGTTARFHRLGLSPTIHPNARVKVGLIGKARLQGDIYDGKIVGPGRYRARLL